MIQGDFTPGREPKVLKFFLKLLGVFLGITVVASLVIYGINVSYESDINEVGQKTRQLNEMNKELLVKLNHIQSYKNVETAAEKVPQLHLSDEVVEVMHSNEMHFPTPPEREGAFPRVTGY